MTSLGKYNQTTVGVFPKFLKTRFTFKHKNLSKDKIEMSQSVSQVLTKLISMTHLGDAATFLTDNLPVFLLLSEH